MILKCFDSRENRLPDCELIGSCRQKTSAKENTCTVRGYRIPETAHYIAFSDADAALRMYEIKEREENEITREHILKCESIVYELGTEAIIERYSPTDSTAANALHMALLGTRWEVGRVDSGVIASIDLEYVNPLEALNAISDAFDVYYSPRIEHNKTAIVHRYIDLTSKMPVWKGKRFELGKDILTAQFTEDRRNVATAILPLGKKIGKDEDAHYVDIKPLVWSTAAGDPCDKPAGSPFLVDADATQRHGVMGARPRYARKMYSSIEDPAELAAAAWADLQKNKEPLLYGKISVIDLERMGFPHEAARLYDEVAFLCSRKRYRSKIVEIEREYAAIGQDRIVFGDVTESMQTQLYRVQQGVELARDMALANDLTNRLPEGLLDGYIDTAKTRILSSVTHRTTDTDGGDMYVTADGTKAIKLTGAGILCANTKIGEAWQWKTAIEGDGIVTQMLTAGVLQAALIRIVGSEYFLWDAENIIITDPGNAQRQIRIGRYNGTNYGIGFTTDGGANWMNAMDFDGIRANIKGNGISIDENGISMFGKVLNVVAGMLGDENYFELNALLGWLRTGYWTFDRNGAKFSQGNAGFQLRKQFTTASLVSNNLHMKVGADLQHGLDLSGSHIQFTIDSLDTSIVMSKITSGYTYNDICFVCAEAGGTWDSAVGNIGTTSNRWDILWCDTIHYRSLNSSSSRAVKKYIKPLQAPGDALDALQPVSFVYKGDARSKKQLGLIYEDTVGVLPEICIPAETKNDIDGIDYTKLIPLLLAEIKDLRRRVKELEQRG